MSSDERATNTVARMVLYGAVFVFATYLIYRFDWGQGPKRAVVSVVIAACTFVLLRRQPFPPVVSAGALWFAQLCVLAAMAANLGYFAHFFGSPRVNDLGTTTLEAGRVIAAGLNPYSEPVAPFPRYTTPLFQFNGFKYMPVMAFVYMPLGLPFNQHGLLVTNLVLMSVCAFLTGKLAERAGGPVAGFFAAALFLAEPFIRKEAFRSGTIDLAPMTFLLIAFLVYEKRPLIAGLMVGLSLSTKLMPAALVFFVCMPASGRKNYVRGFVVGLIPAMIFFLFDPVSFYSNLFLWLLTRRPDSTSWFYGLSPVFRWAATLVAFTVLCTASWMSFFRKPGLHVRMGMAVLVILFLTLSGSENHLNYAVWWGPFAAAFVAPYITGIRRKHALY